MKPYHLDHGSAHQWLCFVLFCFFFSVFFFFFGVSHLKSSGSLNVGWESGVFKCFPTLLRTIIHTGAGLPVTSAAALRLQGSQQWSLSRHEDYDSWKQSWRGLWTQQTFCFDPEVLATVIKMPTGYSRSQAIEKTHSQILVHQHLGVIIFNVVLLISGHCASLTVDNW